VLEFQKGRWVLLFRCMLTTSMGCGEHVWLVGIANHFSVPRPGVFLFNSPTYPNSISIVLHASWFSACTLALVQAVASVLFLRLETPVPCTDEAPTLKVSNMLVVLRCGAISTMPGEATAESNWQELVRWQISSSAWMWVRILAN
jgi:hypothetical protein